MASTKKVAAYGTWSSPITTEIVSGSSLQFSEVHVNPTNGAIYLIEGRPSEKGRAAIVEIKDGKSIDIVPKEYNARTKVHEYGGGAAAVSPDGSIIFNDFYSDGVFIRTPSGETKEIIKGAPDSNLRFANFDVHPKTPSIIAAIQEEHRGKSAEEVFNTIAIINSSTKKAEVIVSGADFYAHPKFSPDGKKICWLQWNHPDMPWTGTELYVADWDGEKVGKAVKITGQARTESIAQPKWHVDDTLLFCSDRTGFWQLYRSDGKGGDVELLPIKGFEEAELGGREFILGFCTYVSMNENQLVITYTKKATNGLVLFDLATKSTTELPVGLVSIQGCAVKKVSSTSIAVISGSLDAPTALYLIDITNPSSKKLLKSSTDAELPTSVFSPAQTIEFPRTHGDDIGGTSYAMFIPPKNPDFEAPSGAKPPMIVFIHGGPTSHVSPALNLGAQYYTSRGYAYCYVNYAGSTGYGRKYREELDYNWGLKDCEDTVSCIDYLAGKGLIDGSKVGITGGSAGGYTTLQGMCTFPKAFAAGNSLYGVGNLRSLAADTHKFESHYLFALLFPPSATKEEQDKVYHDRSPCFHAKNIERPLLLLQGDIDKVVPQEQAEEMEKLLKEKGADVKLVIFKGEGHGFKMKEHMQKAIELEEGLWRRTLL
ncbi:related to dipeptidyl aminopeptidases/acylaminoacyl-peptidases [Phialocephala subalpina]|uniref:Related to dipeptidyl aminopeptidases/acylaminoacyl-peptidases n=1 Tax=Phialocephala subalpina TaxID=576137 RepID=A0A1L7XRE6_9HELO|nr:related to dipeptidyl aminopeptidases/acylaminoacyl-peptidases [Phialocephala subalpina]